MNIDDLKCCGNCDNFLGSVEDWFECGIVIDKMSDYDQSCSKWKWDGDTKEVRQNDN